jgi:DNA-binding transcriptional LysR family regulator
MPRSGSLQRRHLEAIVAIADHRSVHAASRGLGMAQPALSRLLAEAERLLGATLFERSSHGSRPTDAGARAIVQARFLLRGLERLSGGAGADHAPVRLGCIARAMHALMPAVLERVYPDQGPEQANHASPRLRLTEGSSAALMEAVARGELDFAILRRAGSAEAEEGLDVETLYDERTVIIAAPQASDTHGLVAPSSLAHRDWVLPQAGTGSRTAFDHFWSELGLPPVRPVIEARSFETSLALVEKTRFLSIAPESIARRHAALGLLRVVRTRKTLPASPVMLAHAQWAMEDPVLAAVRGIIRGAAAQARAALRGARH